MTVIEKLTASIEKLHGGDRDQSAKHRDYNEWLARRGPHCDRSIMPTKPFRQSDDWEQRAL